MSDETRLDAVGPKATDETGKASVETRVASGFEPVKFVHNQPNKSFKQVVHESITRQVPTRQGLIKGDRYWKSVHSMVLRRAAMTLQRLDLLSDKELEFIVGTWAPVLFAEGIPREDLRLCLEDAAREHYTQSPVGLSEVVQAHRRRMGLGQGLDAKFICPLCESAKSLPTQSCPYHSDASKTASTSETSVGEVTPE